MKINKDEIELEENENEKALPVRMCASCKERKEKNDLFRLAIDKERYVLDKKNIIQSRGIYVCKNPVCIEKLSKNKKYKIEIEMFLQMLNDLKKSKKNIVQKLSTLGNIKEKVFGVKTVREKIWKNEIKLVIISNDMLEKNKEKIISDCNQKQIKYFIGGTKDEIGQVFGKNEINVIGILDEKIAFGLIKSLGGEPVEGT